MFHKFLLSIAAVLALALAGCGGGVDLNEYDENNTGTTEIGSGTQVGGAQTGSVESTAGPSAEVARIVYFDYDSYVVRDEFRPAIAANARYLRDNPRAQVSLQGHTDERGSAEYNLALGQKRAEAVRQALLLLGVNESQIEAVSYGKERPAAYGSGEEAWSQNRRVEFVYR